MSLLQILGISVALAMDAFAVSVASGVCLMRPSLRQMFRLAWHFAFFQAMMPVIGWLGGNTIRDSIEAFDHWVAFGLLALIGGNMIREGFGTDEGEGKRPDPTRGVSLVMLSVATSIDALAVGLSLSVLGVSIWFPALIIGVVAGVFTLVGMRIGCTIGSVSILKSAAEVLGGLTLLAIGGKILWEHGVFG